MPVRKPRPWAEWGLIAASGVLLLGGFQRVVTSIANWYWLVNAGVIPGPLYFALSGGLWSLTGLLALFWMLLRGPAYRWVVLAAAGVYAGTYWIDRLLVSRADRAGDNLVFSGLVTIIGLAFAAVTLRPWRGSR